MSAETFENIGVGLRLGTHRMRCPKCDKRTRDDALAVTVKSNGLVWLCHRCGFTGWRREDSFSYRNGSPRQAPKAPTVHLKLARNYLDFWRALRAVEGAARAYLQARGCALPPTEGDLRWAAKLRHPSDYVGPALVALVTDAETGEAITLHKTWIRPDGSKPDIERPRLLLGKHRKKNGVIRLWPDEDVTTSLAITEGIETALSVAHVVTPVWSAIDAGNLAAFPVLPGIECLSIFADHDIAGLKAADQCAERWYRAGRKVKIVKPPVEGTDFNDVVRSAA